MNPERFRRIDEFFNKVVDLSPSEREAILQSECTGDPQLRQEVEAVLAGDSTPDSELAVDRDLAASAVHDALTKARSDEGPAQLPEQIGRYRPRRILGRGGMGIVYEAEQDQPRRLVALKVLARHDLSGEMLGRFRQEAEILGCLKHPGIAQVFDSGRLDPKDGGHAYLAMELVDGRPLIDHATTNRLSTTQRLQLFALVCDAVQHAHQKGIIHRDLKPDNILVTADGVPKILDFGIARVTDSDLQVTTIQTQAGQLVGTITYMSPEQVAGDLQELDLRSDIYALGVLLFELLTGTPPHDLIGRSIPDAIRLIQEVDPRRLGSIDTTFRGDVDMIVSKAMDKDADRRYASAAELAADIRRHLSNEPIEARPASTFYQLRKFARRHRPIVAGVIATLLALTVGLVLAINYALRESRQRTLADASEFQGRRTAYRMTVAAALSSARATSHVTARHQLEQAAAGFRGWEWRHAKAQLDTKILSYPGEGTTDVARRSDGELVGVLIRDGQPLTIDLATGETIAEVSYPGELTQLRLSSDSRRFGAVCASEGAVLIWDVTTGALIHRCALGAPEISDWSLGWDGEVLAAIQDKRISLVEAANGAVIAVPRRTRGRRGLPCFDRPGLMAIEPAGGSLKLYSREPEGEFTVAASRRVSTCYFVTLDPETSECAAGDENGLIEILSFPALETVNLMRGINGAVRAIDYGPHGHFVAGSGEDGTLQMWDRGTGERRASILAPPTPHIALGQDCMTIATGLTDEVAVWRWSTEAVRVLEAHESYVYFVAYSPDGTMLASAGWDQAIRLWDTRTWETLGVLKISQRVVDGIAFSADGSRLMSPVRVWDIATGEVTEWLDESPDFLESRHAGMFSYNSADREEILLLDRRRLRVATGEAPFRSDVAIDEGATDRWHHLAVTWDDETQEVRVHIDGVEKMSGSLGVHVALDPDGCLYLGQNQDSYCGSLNPQQVLIGHLRDVRVWDVARSGAAIAADHARRLTGREDNLVAYWPLDESAGTTAYDRAGDNHLTLVGEAEWSVDQADDRPFGAQDAGVEIVGRSGALRRTNISGFPTEAFTIEMWTRTETQRLDSRWPEYPSATKPWRLRLPYWHRAQGGAKSRRIGVRGGEMYASSPDRRLLTMTSDRLDGSVVVVERETGAAVLYAGPYDSTISATALDAEGSLLAAGEVGGTIHVLETATGARVATLTGHRDEVFTLTFSPDGTRLASGGQDGVVRLWDTEHWDLVLELSDHTSYVHSVVFSPDGTQLVSGSGDGTVRIYDTAAPAARKKQSDRAKALREEVTPMVEQLLDEVGDPTRAAAQLRGDPTLDETQRDAALRVLLHKSSASSR